LKEKVTIKKLSGAKRYEIALKAPAKGEKNGFQEDVFHGLSKCAFYHPIPKWP
jgi:hypothetical protein